MAVYSDMSTAANIYNQFDAVTQVDTDVAMSKAPRKMDIRKELTAQSALFVL